MRTRLLIDHRPAGGGHHLHALLTISGDAPAAGERRPLNLALVLDRSGSMAGPKLAAVKAAAGELVRRLHPDDRVSLVAFDDHVRVLSDASHDGATSLHAALDTIDVGGLTNLSGGWLRGRELVERSHRKGDLTRIVLLTDGLANQGITGRGDLAALCSAAAGQGVSTTTIGVGADFDEELLAAMADAGAGSTYYVERPDQAVGVFEEEVLGLLGLVAQNLGVTLVPGPGASLTRVHHSYPARAAGQRLELDLGDLYAREPRQVLVEFEVDAETTAGIGTFTVAADVITEGGGMEHREIVLPITFDPTEGPRVEPEVQRVRLLLEAAAARREAIHRGDEGDLPGAAFTLREVAAELRASPRADDAPIAEEARDLEALAASLAEEAEFRAADRKYLHQSARDLGASSYQKLERIRRQGPGR